MTATISKAASNGSAASVPAERSDGMARLHEEECYHLTHMVRNALNAAERLTEKVNKVASARYCDPNGDNDTPPLDVGELWNQLSEARACVRTADDYLRQVLNAVSSLDGAGDQDVPPPF